MELHRASRFTLQQLTDAYNQTRVDYIVPMPMNVARLREYVEAFDVDLDGSWVAMQGHIIFGLGMLGVRSDRAWITRVGVLPIGRRQGTGRSIVNRLVQSAERRGCREIWIEVISGNVPAHQLFLTGGFQPIRELLVARRPPSHTSPLSEQGLARGPRIEVDELDRRQIQACLGDRKKQTNWLNQTESFQRMADVRGLQVKLEGGGRGWVIYQLGEFQLSHIVVDVVNGEPGRVTTSILRALHRRHLAHDAVMENMGVESPFWPGFQSVGYFEVFRRLEMVRRMV